MDKNATTSSEEIGAVSTQPSKESESMKDCIIKVESSSKSPALSNDDMTDDNQNKASWDSSIKNAQDEDMEFDIQVQSQRNALSSKIVYVEHNPANVSFEDDEFGEPLIPMASVVDLHSEDNDKRPPGDQERKHYGAGGNPPNPRPVEIRRFNILNIVRCNTHNQAPHDDIPYLDDKRQRLFFTAKIFFLKAIHMLISLGLVLQLAEFDGYRELHLKYHSLTYLVVFLYMMLYIAIRIGNYGKKISGAIICLLINTLCIVLITSSIYINADEYLASGMLTVLFLSYLAISIQSVTCRVDITESNNIVFLYLGFVFVTTIGSLTFLTNVFPAQSPIYPARMISGIFLPLWMVAECIILLQLSEVAQIILGFRFESPHRTLDFLRAASYLL